MKISNLFNSGKTVFSFEVFPPKKTSPIESVYGKLEEISALKPDFISVTYSAGGSGSEPDPPAACGRQEPDGRRPPAQG